MRIYPDKWLLSYAITKGTPGSNDSGSEPHDTEEAARAAYTGYARSLPVGYRVTTAFIDPPVALGRGKIMLKR